jgi:hypothetical protein
MKKMLLLVCLATATLLTQAQTTTNTKPAETKPAEVIQL